MNGDKGFYTQMGYRLQNAGGLTDTMEDYLEMIARCAGEAGYVRINQLAEKGVAIIMVSSELPEVLGMSDRVMVIHEGRVAGILDRCDATPESIMTLATGGQ